MIAESNSSDFNILLIEDDAGLRRIISRRLNVLRINVSTSATGKEAIEQLTRRQFDLVLLDYKLPDTNAEKLIAGNWKTVGNPPFIILTGYGDERVAVKLMRLGAEDYIIKEDDFLDHLLSVVERTFRHLESKQQLQEAEQSLIESQERLDLALQASGIAVWDVDLIAKSAIVDKHWETLAGRTYSEREVPLVDLYELIHPDDLPMYQLQWDQFIGQSSTDSFEATYRICRQDEEERWIQDKGIVANDGVNGNPVRVIRILHDITARMRIQELENQLRHAQKMETVGTLAGGIAHDFNNVLAAIIGFSELTLRRPEQAETVSSNVKSILQAAHRARDVVRQILLFSRQVEVAKRKINLCETINEAVSFMRAATPRHIDIYTELAVENAEVEADPVQLGQVLANLLSNAAQAIGNESGLISVHLSEGSLDSLNTGLPNGAENADCYVLEVVDTGEGIPDDIIDRIFEPFFTTKEHDKGTGLGLATCQGIVTHHGGRITASSALGKGSTFTIYLPMSVGDDVVEEKLKDDQGSDAITPLRILFVDDELPIAEVGKRLLEEYGMKVNIENDPFEAFSRFRRSTDGYDLIISDYAMPGMNGLELIRKVKELRPNVPTVLISGNLDAQQLNSGLEDQSTILLRKPYSIDQMIDVIMESQKKQAPELLNNIKMGSG